MTTEMRITASGMVRMMQCWRAFTVREQDILLHRLNRPTDSNRETARTFKLNPNQYNRAKKRILKLLPESAAFFDEM